MAERMKVKFFSSAEQFRKWIERNHETATELIVGFHKKASGKKSITYSEALDEALCFGWIDGVRRNIDQISYSIRFSPRKPNSIWSLININHVERLKNQRRMRPAGLAVFARRNPRRIGVYSFENAPLKFSPAYEKKFRQNKTAWKFFDQQPPSFTRVAIFWVMSAKKEETQMRRLLQLIENAELGIRRGAIVGEGKR
jgi:uncharacterized protein YdeI (YjbR/CyaY-like superfamily)